MEKNMEEKLLKEIRTIFNNVNKKQEVLNRRPKRKIKNKATTLALGKKLNNKIATKKGFRITVRKHSISTCLEKTKAGKQRVIEYRQKLEDLLNNPDISEDDKKAVKLVSDALDASFERSRKARERYLAKKAAESQKNNEVAETVTETRETKKDEETPSIVDEKVQNEEANTKTEEAIPETEGAIQEQQTENEITGIDINIINRRNKGKRASIDDLEIPSKRAKKEQIKSDALDEIEIRKGLKVHLENQITQTESQEEQDVRKMSIRIGRNVSVTTPEQDGKEEKVTTSNKNMEKVVHDFLDKIKFLNSYEIEENAEIIREKVEKGEMDLSLIYGLTKALGADKVHALKMKEHKKDIKIAFEQILGQRSEGNLDIVVDYADMSKGLHSADISRRAETYKKMEHKGSVREIGEFRPNIFDRLTGLFAKRKTTDMVGKTEKTTTEATKHGEFVERLRETSSDYTEVHRLRYEGRANKGFYR